MKIRWSRLILCILIVYGVGFAGSIFSSAGISSDWYRSVKPSITPPDYIFPIVWNILFFLIAISLYLAWMKSDRKEKTKITAVFGINFILNILWSFLYFRIQSPFFAFIEIIFLWLSVAAMIYTTYKIDKASSYLLIPYILWVSFAIVLNYLSI